MIHHSTNEEDKKKEEEEGEALLREIIVFSFPYTKHLREEE
jgi:predicted Ser/Thr protein kinase